MKKKISPGKVFSVLTVLGIVVGGMLVLKLVADRQSRVD